jgi:hypothetical protein
MLYGSAHPRPNTKGRKEFLPEFGARHPVKFDNVVLDFFGDLDFRWGKIIPERVVVDDHMNEHYRRQYTLYDDRDKIGMTVMEKRLSAEHARHKRLKWNANDVGRVTGRIEDEIARLGMPEGDFDVELTNIVRVGDATGRAGERKLAAIVDQHSRAAEFMVREHEIVSNGLGVALKGFKYPYSEYIPKFTVGRLFKEVAPASIDECIEAAQGLLPITVTVAPVSFFARQEV